MNLRTRLVLAFAIVALTPLLIVGLGLRREVDRRMTADFDIRLGQASDLVARELTRVSDRLASQLTALARALEDDNDLRLALTRAEGGDLIDYANHRLVLTGLALLRLQDDSGQIISSGHFPGEAGRSTGSVADSLAAHPESFTLLEARAPGGDMLVLARVDSIVVAGRRYRLVGGLPVDLASLGTLVGDGRLSLVRSSVTETPVVEAVTFEIGFDVIVIADSAEPAASAGRLVVSAELTQLDILRRRVDWWLGLGAGATAVMVLLASWIAAGRISRPLADLADRTARVDLTTLDVDFDSDRTDEVGRLSDLLGDMMRRLRVSRDRLTEAERRATIGDVARQLNHDIKNGLTPIRNVVTHLGELAETEPDAMARTFRERRRTLDDSIGYLESLARSLSGLTPAMRAASCDLNQLLGESAHQGHGSVQLDLDSREPAVQGDPVALRRVFHNLIGNALDSVSGSGTVSVTSEIAADGDGGAVARAIVRDDGPGMTNEQLDKAFAEWYTTKRDGTGLGLPIVRRLVLDLGGKLRVETAPGHGTRVIVELPLASNLDMPEPK